MILLLSLGACKRGPRVEVCIVDGDNLSALCSFASGKERVIRGYEMDNYACMAPDDFGKFLARCKDPRNNPAPNLTVCVVNGSSLISECSEADGDGFALPFSGMDNFACLSPKHMRSVLLRCKRNGADYGQVFEQQ